MQVSELVDSRWVAGVPHDEPGHAAEHGVGTAGEEEVALAGSPGLDLAGGGVGGPRGRRHVLSNVVPVQQLTRSGQVVLDERSDPLGVRTVAGRTWRNFSGSPQQSQ